MDRITRINMLVNNTGFMLGTDDMQWMMLIVNNTAAFYFMPGHLYTRKHKNVCMNGLKGPNYGTPRYSTLLHSVHTILHHSTVSTVHCHTPDSSR
jgi:hypothetical protein